MVEVVQHTYTNTNTPSYTHTQIRNMQSVIYLVYLPAGIRVAVAVWVSGVSAFHRQVGEGYLYSVYGWSRMRSRRWGVSYLSQSRYVSRCMCTSVARLGELSDVDRAGRQSEEGGEGRRR